MDELIRKLEERRKKLTDRAAELLTLAASRETLSNTPEEIAEYDRLVGTDGKPGEIGEIDAQIKRFAEQAEREQRAAAARAGQGTGTETGAAGIQVTSEPTTYGEHSGHSYFLDLCRVTMNRGDADGGVQAARERQQRHQQELSVDLPKREQRRARDADKMLEHRLSGADLEGGNRAERRMARRERRALERFQAFGIPAYEKRIISRTDGQGGYEVPPLWLVDEYIPYLRAGRTFADLWHNFPLPSGTDSINIPRFVTGTATGTQPGDGAPVPSRDAADNFVQARIMTVAGQEDAAMQLLDQSPLNYDEIVFQDLSADYNMQVSAQLMLGSGFPQLNGMYQNGQLWGNATLGTGIGPTTSGFYLYASGTAANGNLWTGPGTSGTAYSLYTAAGQLKSQLGRNRFLPPTAWVANSAVWEALSTATDSQNRPLVVPDQNGPFNAVAVDQGPVVEGLQGKLLSLPLYVDPNIPLTFGGTGAVQPYIGAVSNGHTAPYPGATGTSSGGNVPVFTPLIAARWDDLFFWEGDIRTRVLSEVLSGSLAVRFQLYAYCASMPNRYQDSSGNLMSYGNVNSIGTLAAALSQGTAGGLVGF